MPLSVDRNSLPYRECVGIAVFNRAGQVFIGRRISEGDPEDSAEHGAPWQMPQGGIDAGETPIEAARRELLEETNIRSIELIAEAADWIVYDLPDALVGVAWKGRYRGQRQRWFAFLFTGEDSEIDIVTPAGGDHAEFESWRWEDLAVTAEIVVDFKREAYRAVGAAFAGIPAQLAGR